MQEAVLLHQEFPKELTFVKPWKKRTKPGLTLNNLFRQTAYFQNTNNKRGRLVWKRNGRARFKLSHAVERPEWSWLWLANEGPTARCEYVVYWLDNWHAPFEPTNYVLDFPKTADGRVYHLGVRIGEVANRIVSCRILPRYYLPQFSNPNLLDYRWTLL